MILPFKIAATTFILFLVCLYMTVVHASQYPWRDTPVWLGLVGGVSILVAVMATIWGIWAL